jgi:hypothetical protein
MGTGVAPSAMLPEYLLTILINKRQSAIRNIQQLWSKKVIFDQEKD